MINMALSSPESRKILQGLRESYYYGYAKSPDSDELIQALDTAIKAMDLVEQLQSENNALSEKLRRTQMDALQQEEQFVKREEKAYDLGIESVLHNFLGYPWKDAADACNLLRDSITAKREGRLLALPCSPGADAYVIDTDAWNCEACRHGKNAPATEHERYERKRLCRCGEYCPLYIRAIPVENFAVKSSGDLGWSPDFPVYFADSATPGEKIALRISGVTDDVFFTPESAQAFLTQFAQQHDTDYLPGIRRE